MAPPAEAGALSLPLRRLRIELGLDCPLRCVHCSAQAAQHHPLALPSDLVHRLVEEFAALGGEEITFTGGEPLVDPRLTSLLSRARTLRLSTVVFTSGTVHGREGPVGLSAARAGILAPSLDRAVISVYAADPTLHDAITRTQGSLALTREAIVHLVGAGVRVELHFVPTSTNYRDLPALVADASSLGVAAIRIIRYVPQGRGRTQRDHLRLDAVQQDELRTLLAEARATSGIQVRVGSAFGYLLADVPACTAAVDEMVVGADGRVYPCSGFAGISGPTRLGNVRDQPLATIWESSPYLQAVRAMALAQASTAASPGCHPGCPAQKAATGGTDWARAADPDAAALGQASLPTIAQAPPR